MLDSAVIHVEMDVVVEQSPEAVLAVKKAFDHHIEQLLDLEEWPEIKCVLNVKSEEV